MRNCRHVQPEVQTGCQVPIGNMCNNPTDKDGCGCRGVGFFRINMLPGSGKITVCDAELGSNSITDEGAAYRLYV